MPAAPCLSRGRCSVLGGPPALRPEHRGLVIVGGGGGATVRSAWSYKSTPSTDSTDRSLDRQHDSACSTRARMGNGFSSAEWPTGSTRAQSGIENKCTRAVCHIPGTIFITLLLVLCNGTITCYAISVSVARFESCFTEIMLVAAKRKRRECSFERKNVNGVSNVQQQLTNADVMRSLVSFHRKPSRTC